MKKDLAGVVGEWRTGSRVSDGRRRNTNRRPVSVPASPRTSGIKRRATTKQKLRMKLTRMEDNDDVPTKRPPVVKSGINTVTNQVEQNKAQLAVTAYDVDP